MPTSRAANVDPFAELMAPPPNETPMEREMREQLERSAKMRSDAIDDELRRERAALKDKRVLKLLLLGQSESGKSTTLRQFQLAYTPSAFKSERATWRGVIQLNVVRSVRLILDTVMDAVEPNTQPVDGEEPPVDYHVRLTPEHEALCKRLDALRVAELKLMSKFRAPAEEGETYALAPVPENVVPDAKEPSVRADWKRPLRALRNSNKRPGSVESGADLNDEPTQIIYELRSDIIALWNDHSIRELLRRRKVRMEEVSGFFLNDADRVTSRNYFPSDGDVLRARLKTEGVSEYVFQMESSEARAHASEWRIIDVGGARSQRHAWAPFMDDASAIIFLAPISAFDQVLAEDRSVNRLEDSVMLWKQICQNKLLAGIELILFLNKMDILEAKLKAGVRLSKYVRNFGDRPNDVETAAKYFRSKFHAIHREYSPAARKFYAFTTSVTVSLDLRSARIPLSSSHRTIPSRTSRTARSALSPSRARADFYFPTRQDVATTGGILAAVRDILIRQNLKESQLM
ncbi:G-alpha-domain-containing protein [Auriculariales sp. MPI-PUGE-AT-0066]|nr:G-alpha-domain-containing protein [Auriculariales sp. MPI-PUGE-AT-0066]